MKLGNPGSKRTISRRSLIGWTVGIGVVLALCMAGIGGTNESDEPAPVVSPTRVATASPARQASPKATPTTSKNDPRFDNCTEAVRKGYGPYRRGIDPEYGWYQDRDGDGVVCERR